MTIRKSLRSLDRWANRAENGRRLDAFRVGVAICFLIKFWDFFPFFRAPSIKSLPLFCIAFLATIALLIGIFVRTSALVLATTAVLFFEQWSFAERIEKLHNQQTQLLILCLLGICLQTSTNSAGFSLWPSQSRKLRSYGIGLKLLRVLLLLIYSTSVYASLNDDYVSGMAFERLYSSLYMGFDPGGGGLPGRVFQTFALSSVAAQIFVVCGLLFAPFRRIAVVFGIVFQLLLFLTIPVSIFSFLIILLLLLFWPSTRPKTAVGA